MILYITRGVCLNFHLYKQAGHRKVFSFLLVLISSLPVLIARALCELLNVNVVALCIISEP